MSVSRTNRKTAEGLRGFLAFVFVDFPLSVFAWWIVMGPMGLMKVYFSILPQDVAGPLMTLSCILIYIAYRHLLIIAIGGTIGMFMLGLGRNPVWLQRHIERTAAKESSKQTSSKRKLSTWW